MHLQKPGWATFVRQNPEEWHMGGGMNYRVIMAALCTFILVSMASLTNALADGGASILNERCASCHDLKGPAPTTLAKLWQRKGPDLFYAGNKYNQAWIEAWLQNPKRIRPAGMFYRQHIKPGPKHDIVDTSTLKPHIALTKAEANAVANALMKLKANSALTAKEKLVSAPSPLGEMMFDKISGCMACHQIEPGFGGMSGAEVFTAGRRLQPAFMLSFIKNPQAWDPKTWMPNKHLPADNVQQLVNYLIDLSRENFDE